MKRRSLLSLTELHPVRWLSTVALSAYAFAVLAQTLPSASVDVRRFVLLGSCASLILMGNVLLRWGGPMLGTFMLFTALFMGFAPAYQLANGRIPATTPSPPFRYLEAAWTTVLVGTLMFLVSYMSIWRWKAAQPKFREADVGIQGSKLLHRKTNDRLALSLLVGIVLVSFYIANVGIQPLLTSRSALDDALSSWSGGDRAFMVVLRTFSLFGPAVALVAPSVSQLKLTSTNKLLRAVLATLLLLALNPISSPRILVGCVWGGMALALVISKYGTRSVGSFTGIFATMFLVMFPFADAFRRGYKAPEFESPIEVLAKSDFDAFAQLLNALWYTDVEAPRFMWQFAGALLFWVPRSSWPGKPMDSGVMLAEFRGYNVTNLSAPIWAEGVLNGGLIGVAVLLCIAGIFAALLDRSLTSIQVSRRTAVRTLLCFAAPYSLIVYRGSLLQAVSVVTVIALASLVMGALLDAPQQRGGWCKSDDLPRVQRRVYRVPEKRGL